jgi:hypothetical protein
MSRSSKWFEWVRHRDMRVDVVRGRAHAMQTLASPIPKSAMAHALDKAVDRVSGSLETPEVAMLPLMVLATLVGAGLVINRNEQADSEEAPEVEHEERRPRKDGAMPLPYRPPKTKKSPTWDDLRAQREQKLAPRNAEALDHRGEPMAAPAGPFGDGPMAHFTESQVGSISQAPAQLARAGAGVDPAHQALHAKREIQTPGPPVANRLIVPPTAGIDEERSRYSLPYSKNSVAPIEAERERPLGETSSRIRRAAEPRDVDKLRSASNPKDVKGGRFVAAPFGFNVPGKPGSFTKRNRAGESSLVPGDANGHFGTGAAAVRRGASDGEYLLPRTQRGDGGGGGGDGGRQGSLMGPAARAMGFSTSQEIGEMRHTSPSIMSMGHTGFLAGGPRDRDRGADVSMYGEDLGIPGRGSGAPRVGGAHAAPMGTRAPLRMPDGDTRSDGRDGTGRKSLLTPAPRHFGELQIANNPPKQTIYEPEALRTTMRETSIHDTHEGMLRGIGAPGETRSPDTEARPTIRETIGSVQGSYGDDGRLDGTVSLSKPPVYDPNDVFDTTTKETTEANTRMGNVGAYQGLEGPGAQPETPSTQRAFDADSTRAHYFGNASREQADAYRAHTSGTRRDGSMAWREPDTTNRDVSACTDYKGAASARIKAFPSDGQAYTRIIGDAKERILRQRSPNGRKALISPGAHDAGVDTWRRDPCTDTTPSRLVFQNQGRSQRLRRPDTCHDTRGGRHVHETMPDTVPLQQLRDNPYAIDNVGIVQGDGAR